MGQSLTVLDWQDIGVLTHLCNKSTDAEGHEQDRLRLVEALREFLTVWQPGHVMQNDLRRRLVEALDSYLATADTWGDQESSPEAAGNQIRLKLLRAIEAAERGETSEDRFESGGPLLVLLALAFQRLTDFFGQGPF